MRPTRTTSRLRRARGQAQRRARRRARTRGFTLTELLVAISVIILIIAITFPVISSIQSGSRIEAGLNTVGMTADVARQWVAPSAWEEDSADKVVGERYSGCAAMFCPTGEVRIVTNFRNAENQRGVFMEEMSPEVNGYWDLRGVDYISIPAGVGVAGIYRRGNTVSFLAPPFAIAFNEKGQMSFGDITGHIYYDSDGDTRYDMSRTRPGGYDPVQWDGESGSNNEDVDPDTLVREPAPFEAIECVPGVIIYDSNDFANAGFDFAGGGAVTLNSPEGQWLQANGRTLFFSPSTGVALRDEQE
ncbi:MAG: prepilin-type N-terminal cleavage/methylation domain-containing protein [Phycisphaeraceae bacterium]